MAICDVCSAIDLFKVSELYRRSLLPQNRSKAPVGWKHHATYRDLRLSAATCESCALFYQESNADEQYPNKPPIDEGHGVYLHALIRDQSLGHYQGRATSPSGACLLGLKVDVAGGGLVSYWKSLDVWAENDSSELLADDVIPSRVGLAHDVTMIAAWLLACHEMHPGCKLKGFTSDEFLIGEATALPTRVINVGSAGSGQDLFLFETMGLRGAYLALSHCWGREEVIVTKTSTLSDHKKRVPIELLPQNFRDAIFITQQLGYQYLWIDSLCIIQDSPEDWDIESSRMAQVCNGCTLTLCAANAAAANDGFLKPRLPLEQRSAKLPHPNRTGSLDGHYYITERLSDFDTDVERGPLNKRVWTLQERALSRRKVFFEKDQFHWECQEAQLSERTGLLLLTSGTPTPRGILELSTVTTPNLYNLWYSIATEFTKHSLTKGDDALPALSGVASVFHTSLNANGNHTYAAGLWTQDLARGLL